MRVVARRSVRTTDMAGAEWTRVRTDEAVAELRYGTVVFSARRGVGYLTAAATWGCLPRPYSRKVQSGIGVVDNAPYSWSGPERTVVRGPFRPAPRSVLHGEMAMSLKPPWFVTNRTAATRGRLLTGFAAVPGWSAMPRIFASALRG